MVVERRHDDELLPAGLGERLAQADPDLLERLQAVRRETRRRDEDARTASCEIADDLVRERPEPAPAEPRLERERPRRSVEPEIARERARRALALAAVRISARDARLGQPVEAEHEVIGPRRAE